MEKLSNELLESWDYGIIKVGNNLQDPEIQPLRTLESWNSGIMELWENGVTKHWNNRIMGTLG